MLELVISLLRLYVLPNQELIGGEEALQIPETEYYFLILDKVAMAIVRKLLGLVLS